MKKTTTQEISGIVDLMMTSMNVRNIPENLRRKFKSKCASEGISQQDCVIRLMREYVER